jgi:hypothetical protein
MSIQGRRERERAERERLIAVRPLIGDDDLDVRTEVFWASLHGLMTLMRGGRLRREDHAQRLTLLLHRFGD